MRTALLVCALTGAMFAASNAQAATAAPANLAVTANVASACAVTATTTVAFGQYDPLAGAAKNGQGSVTVRCTKGTSYDLALGTGSNSLTASNCVTPARRLTNGTDFLPYQLYTTNTFATVWGCDSTNDVTRISGSSTTGFQHDVFGQIPAGADVSVGNYTDTVAITVTF